MSKLVIMGNIEVAPGKRDQVASAPKVHGARCLRECDPQEEVEAPMVEICPAIYS